MVECWVACCRRWRRAAGRARTCRSGSNRCGRNSRHGKNFCKELDHKPADLALAWLIANPAVTAPIIGPRTMDQLTGSLAALQIKIDDEINQRLNTIWPGPGGEAPGGLRLVN